MVAAGYLRVLVSASVLLALAVSQVHGRSWEDVQADGTLSVAVYRDFPPYAYKVNDKAKGVDVEIAQALAEGLGLKLRLHWMIADENLGDDLRNHVWKGHYLARKEDGPMLQRQVADIMMRVPYDREFAFKLDPDGRVINDLVHFFAPYQRERWALAYDSRQLEPFENLAVFQYQRIGVEIDSLPDFYLSSAFRGRLRNNVEHFPSLIAAFMDMNGQGVSAVMGMQSQLQWGQFQLDNREHLLLADIPFPNLTKRYWDVGMALKDAHRQLAYRVEDVIDAMVYSGQMERLYQSYGINYLRPDRYRLEQ
ncbi:hypothetical protein BGP75_01960 [Motiliproteus sp. MSK22-1]|nr:hypothetical protein BGP75_01960 [Motiliproteus sp. MSK22-1]